MHTLQFEFLFTEITNTPGHTNTKLWVFTSVFFFVVENVNMTVGHQPLIGIKIYLLWILWLLFKPKTWTMCSLNPLRLKVGRVENVFSGDFTDNKDSRWMRLRAMTSREDAKVVGYQTDQAGRCRRTMGMNWDGREIVAAAVRGVGGYVTARSAEENQGSAAETHPMCRSPRTLLHTAVKEKGFIQHAHGDILRVLFILYFFGKLCFCWELTGE